ncbi:MAG: oligosaccharide flippase family protein [Trueperaceae bacterium]
MTVLRNVGILATATGVSQLVSFAVAPLLSRLFHPEEFGVVGVFLALAGVLGVAACLRLDLAVVVPSDEDDAFDVFLVAVLATVAMVGVTAVVVTFAGNPLASLLGDDRVAALLPYLPVYIGAVGVFRALNYWSTRSDRFGRIAGANVMRAITTAGLQLGLGAMALGSRGLLFGYVAGQVVAALVLALDSMRSQAKSLGRALAWSRVRGLVAKYRDFVLYGAPQAVVNSVNQGLPAVILTATFGAGVAGLYLMAHRLVAAPIGLVGHSTRQVLYPRLSRAQDEGNLFPLALRATTTLALAAVVPTVVAVVFAPDLLVWLLGPRWELAGTFSRYLIPWLAVGFVNIPSVTMIPLLEMQRWHAAYEIVYVLARVAALVLGARGGDPVVAIAAFSAVGVLFNTVLIVAPMLRARAAAMRPRIA